MHTTQLHWHETLKKTKLIYWGVGAGVLTVKGHKGIVFEMTEMFYISWLCWWLRIISICPNSLKYTFKTVHFIWYKWYLNKSNLKNKTFIIKGSLVSHVWQQLNKSYILGPLPWKGAVVGYLGVYEEVIWQVLCSRRERCWTESGLDKAEKRKLSKQRERYVERGKATMLKMVTKYLQSTF